MAGRRLNADERALWARVAHSVKPLAKRTGAESLSETDKAEFAAALARPVAPLRVHGGVKVSSAPLSRIARNDSNTLDGGWDKRLLKGAVSPDFTIDLHEETLASAHARLNQSLHYAISIDARVILLITGRPARDNPRLPPTSRGVIRASVQDWLHASPYASAIAAIRPAHPRHGGGGALYVILRRRRG